MAEAGAVKGRWAARFVLAAAAFDVLMALGATTLTEDEVSPLAGAFVAIVAAGWLACLVASIVTVITWEYRAIKAATGGGVDHGLSPSDAIVWWFVPILSLWKPYHVVRDLAAKLAPQVSGDVGVWWVTYVLMNLLSLLSSKGGATAAVGNWGSAAAAVVSAVLLGRIIRAIQAGVDGVVLRDAFE